MKDKAGYRSVIKELSDEDLNRLLGTYNRGDVLSDIEEQRKRVIEAELAKRGLE